MLVLDVLDRSQSKAAGPALYEALGSIARNVGRPEFVGALLTASRQFAPVDFVSVFLFPNRDTPVFVGTEGRQGQRFASSAADHYMSRHYRDDPNLSLMFERGGCEETSATYLRRDDVPTAGYRIWCYDRARIADRFSLISRTERGLPFSVSFYGGQATGDLGEQDRAALLGFFPCIRAAALRHFELWRSRTIDPDNARLRVRERFPALSRRETDVAAGMVAGMTADGIADWLGIASTSVITHRKRAYERIGVANQREFLSVFYGT